MARLPFPGSDDGTWGTVLNEFLQTAHTAGGGLKHQTGTFVAASDASPQAREVAAHVCSGSNDQVEIQQAIDGLPAFGGRVLLSEGTFSISDTIRVENDNVAIIGAGAGERAGSLQIGAGSRLLAAGGVQGAVLRVQRLADDRPVYGTLLRDLVVDGDSVGSAVDGVHFRSNRAHVDHVHVHRCSGNGIRVHGYSNWDTYDTELIACQAGDNAAHNFLFDENAPDAHLIGCIGYRAGLDNLHILTSSLQITSCHFYGAIRNNIHFNNGGSRTKIVNCKIENAGEHGVQLDSSNGTGAGDIQIVGCNLKNNGRSVDNQFDHLHIRGSASAGMTRTLVVGNAFSWIFFNSGGNKPRYGINLDGPAAQSTTVLANSFGPASQFGTAQIRDQGSSSLPSMIRHNMNWRTENRGLATVPAASSSVIVAHGLDMTPSLSEISVTPTDHLGAASRFWITDANASTFTIRLDLSPGGGGVGFAWQAQRL